MFHLFTVAGEHQFVAFATLRHRVAVAELFPVVFASRIQNTGAIAYRASFFERGQHGIANEFAAIAHTFQQ